MDKETSSIDMKSDSFIQETLGTVFTESTMFTAAYRLNTVFDCDRAIVLDKGRLVELDSPKNLLAEES